MDSCTTFRETYTNKHQDRRRRRSTRWRFPWRSSVSDSSHDVDVIRVRQAPVPAASLSHSPSAAVLQDGLGLHEQHAPVQNASDWTLGASGHHVQQGPGVPQEKHTSSADSPPEDSLVQAGRFVDIHHCRYEIRGLLGEGGCAKVYAATRLSDGLQVAIKQTSKLKCDVYMDLPDYCESLPEEIALMLMVHKGIRVPEIIQLLDWQDEPTRYLMVLERPTPCQDLYSFTCGRKGVDEDLARVIMRQVTQAAVTCCQRGVLHSDIKLENLLINPVTLEVKLIDFGCGGVLKNSPYYFYFGTKEYAPPELLKKGKFHGKPMTVWSLGRVMYELMRRNFPDDKQLNYTDFKLLGFSTEFCDLLQRLLQRNPKKRIDLEQILLHHWFQVPDRLTRAAFIIVSSICIFLYCYF